MPHHDGCQNWEKKGEIGAVECEKIAAGLSTQADFLVELVGSRREVRHSEEHWEVEGRELRAGKLGDIRRGISMRLAVLAAPASLGAFLYHSH